ncbi:LysR family transcriptional regulator [Aeromicrobium sp. CnD17-E]|uniref:LysR family transcriptional regulator n=1 Tax=Aeromicrobium sp. CnD17-E TaxID=2954487 RepID=UPI002097CE75|nr:LysR family transcriptional regulator [Aeromicrobium sp. CnD17-E]MCO7239084.1 LysR family transcriptional regulator [Aeromicrobium sp. CnD17-E]
MGATLKQLRIFVALVEEGGFAAAGDALGMSQSSVSHTLATLERHVGAPLVHRARRTVTEDGARLLPHARACLAAAEAFEAATPSQASIIGTITLAITPTAGHRIVPDLLAQWRTHAPGIRVRLLEGDDAEVAGWLDTGAADAAVLIDPDRTDEHVTLACDEFRAVTRTDHPLAGTRPVALVDLLEDPLLASTAGCEPQIKGLHRQAALAYQPAQRVRELTTLMAMVEAGLGVTIMPTLAEPMLPTSLTMTPLAHTVTRELVLTGPATRPWHPLVRTLLSITRDSR